MKNIFHTIHICLHKNKREGEEIKHQSEPKNKVKENYISFLKTKGIQLAHISRK